MMAEVGRTRRGGPSAARQISAARQKLATQCARLAASTGASHVSVCVDGARGPEVVAFGGEALDGALDLHRGEPRLGVHRVDLADGQGRFGTVVAAGVSLAVASVLDESNQAFAQLARQYLDEVTRAMRARLAAGEQQALRIALRSATPQSLVKAMAKAVRRAIGSDTAAVFVPPGSPAELSGWVDGPNEMTPDRWERLRVTLREGGGDSMLRGLGDAGYARADLDDGAPLSPLERWCRDDAGMRSLAIQLVFSRRTPANASVSVGNREPTEWTAEERAFLRQAADVTLVALERLRAASMEPWLRQRADGLAALLGSLGDWRPLSKVAATFARELEVRFGVKCLALVRSANDERTGEVLWAAPGMNFAAEAPGEASPPPFPATAARIPIRHGGSEVGIAWVDTRADTPAPAMLREMEETLATLGTVIGQGRRLSVLDSEQRALQATAGMLGSLATEGTVAEFARIFVAQSRRFFHAAVALLATFSPAGEVHLEAVSSDIVAAGELEARDEAGRAPVDALYDESLEAFPSADIQAGAPDAFARAMARYGIRSVMRAPMLAPDGSRRGIVMVGSTAPGAWRPRHAQSLRDFASALGLVIERQRVIQSMQRQEQRRRAVLGLLSALGPRERVEHVANPLCGAVRRLYSADHCSITLIDGDQAAISGLDSNLFDMEALQSVAGRGTYLEGLFENGYQLINDLSLVVEGPPVLRGLAARGVRSMLRVLIGGRESPLGVIAVASRRPGALTEADAVELREIARPLEVAIGYFERRQESERRANRLEVTNRALEALTYAGTPGELASAFLRECRALFDSAYGLVAQWDGDGEVRVVASDGVDGVTPDDALRGLPSYEWRQLDREPSALSSADAGASEQALEAAGLRHGLCAPLTVGDEVRGAVVIWTGQPQPLPADDLALLATLTRPLSIALERSAAAALLGESESKYRSLIAQAEEMIYLFDSETLEILEANAYGARILGYSDDEMCSLKVTDIVDDSDARVTANVRLTLDEGEARLPARPYRRRDGSVVVMDVVASTIGFEGRQAILVLGRDVSERHVIEQRLIQGQKMEALGQMAGNVAHDFNNLLTTVLGFAGLLKRAPGMDAEALEHLGLIEDAARRAADLSSRMLSFARGGLVKFGPVDLRAVIEQTLRLAEAGMSSAITVRPRLPAKPVIVEGDAGQLQQALLNIVINARDAMPHGGVLTVRLRAAGDGCVLSIADTGMGMTEETRMRLFEPFYTTKPAGSGTGLGMAITYGIVQGHHGSIAVTTALDRGTTFTIRLPLMDVEHLPAPPPPPAAEPGRAYGAVLVVDDDDLVRRTMTATLIDLGYSVVAASGGADAVELVQDDPHRFAAVVLDLVMAGMSGSATFHALQAVRKDLPVIICTGFADDEHVDMDVQRGAAAVIYKPFNPDGLARALQLAGAFADGGR